MYFIPLALSTPVTLTGSFDITSYMVVDAPVIVGGVVSTVKVNVAVKS